MTKLERNSFVYGCGYWTARVALTLLFRIRAWGAEKVPPRGGVLLASNHQSFADPLIVGTPLPRQACYMARRTLFGVPLLRWVIRAVGAFPVDRGGVDRRAMRAAVDLMRLGEAVVVFPEGTRTPDGELKPFTAGFALLAAQARVPIVPVAIHGAFDAWPRQHRLPRPGRVHVAYAEPVGPPGRGKGACREVAEEVWRRVAALQEELKQKD
ncbi:lysophospholipid acyltransferase family protein [Planctomycetota bacterium]